MGHGGARTRSATRRVAMAMCGVVAVTAAACAGDDDSNTARSTTNGVASSTTTTVERPAGRKADLSQELTGGNGVFVGSASGAGLDGSNYVEREYVAAGSASSYESTGALSGDGRWTFQPDGEAQYRTRVIVRRPHDPADFSGTVLVEWLNVSGGIDADPDYATLREEILRQGHAWVGVSTQVIGVMGGPVAVTAPGGSEIAGKGLRAIDPARYDSLEHPGDAYAYDIYTQVARSLRDGGGLGDLVPERVLAVGESQSAFALVTYVNGVQPLTHAFDGFFVHSRGAAALALAGPGESADIAGAIGGTPTIFRTDEGVPVLDVQTEGDVASVINSIEARQPDSDRFRLWEVAGTAHADARLVGDTAKSLDCGVPINNGPLHVVAKAALRALETWVRTGEEPATAPRLETTTGATKAIKRDGDGIALGGIRTPPVDTPVDVLSGAPGPAPSVICLLLGSTKPLPDARLRALYASRADYEQRYDAGIDAAIDAGFVLEDDRDALRAYVDPDRIAR